MKTGTVYLVGAGPGAPDLLTLRAARLLAEADVVFHDALVHPETLALAARAEKIAVGKRCGRHSTAQQFINKRLVDAARRHRVVVRLKGGDPMLFGRAQEEISFLRKHSIQVEVVPGITAALAASAELGVSLTRRGLARSVTFVTPRVGAGEPESSWARAASSADTAAIYMGAGQGPEIAAALIAAGKPPSTPVAVVESASLEEAKVLYATLEQVPRLTGGPVLILVGEVYRVAEHQRDALTAAFGQYKGAIAFARESEHRVITMSGPLSREQGMDGTTEIRIVFDAPPGRDMPTLVTVEDEYGRRITRGQWRERPDGYWELVFRTAPVRTDPIARLN